MIKVENWIQRRRSIPCRYPPPSLLSDNLRRDRRQKARGHWQIENQPHLTLGISFGVSVVIRSCFPEKQSVFLDDRRRSRVVRIDRWRRTSG
jgi:hypothetical protein